MVENRCPGSDLTWPVLAEPAVHIDGTKGNNGPLLLSDVDAIHLGTGTIVVADAATHQLHYYDSRGTFRSSVGGRGTTPGRFNHLLWIEACGVDSVFAYDLVAARVVVFDADGVFRRHVALKGALADKRPYVVRCGTGAWFAGMSWWDETPDRIGPHRPSSALTLITGTGKGRLVGHFPADERYRLERSAFRRPLGRRTEFALSSRALYLGFGVSYEVGMYDASARLLRLIRRRTGALRIHSDQVADYKEEQLRFVRPGARERASKALDQVLYPDSFPPYGRFETDPDDQLWVQDYPRPGERSETWSVFDSTGKWLSEVKLPPYLNVSQVGRDFVLGTRIDSIGGRHIQLHRLLRPSARSLRASTSCPR